MTFMLFWVSTALSFLAGQSYLVTKWLKINIHKPTAVERDLLSAKQELQTEQLQYNMVDDFAKYSKIQRKINALEEKLRESNNKRKSTLLMSVVSFGPQILSSIMLLVLTLYYRRTPLFELPDYIDLTPFNFIISYPNKKNCVSFHFWILSCNLVARLLKFK